MDKREKEKKRKLEIDFKTKNFITTSLDDSKIYYVHHFKTTKKMWDTLEIIYVALPCI